MDRLSSAPTDCRVPDPTDAKADGAFGGTHRAGYGNDRLDRIIATARKGWTLAAGEGLVLVQEIDRLREQLRDTHTEVFHLGEKLSFVERERDQLTSLPAERILAALREPSEKVLLAAVEAVPYGASYAALMHCIPAAVAAAEQEVANDEG
jgi:hypothetical protein